MSWRDLALTDLANLSDALAVLLLADREPRDWGTCRRVHEVCAMVDTLRDGGRMLPASVVEVLRRRNGQLLSNLPTPACARS